MKQSLIWVGIGALVIIGGVYVIQSGKGDVMKKDDGAMMEETKAPDDAAMMENGNEAAMVGGAMMDDKKADGDTMMKNDTAMMEKGSYEAYSAEKLARADSGDVVLFFRASWCPTCKAVDTDIRANLSGIPANLTILDVDYDNASELKKKYGVTYQHTFVQVNSAGIALKKWSGSPTLAALVAEVQ